jgi:hypothetical protein
MLQTVPVLVPFPYSLSLTEPGFMHLVVAVVPSLIDFLNGCKQRLSDWSGILCS